MSPRKTRRGKAKGDNPEDTLPPLDDSTQLSSPSIHSRSVRARRKKDAKEIASPQPIRKTRTRKTLTDSLNQSNISLPTTSRKRGQKKPERPDRSVDESSADAAEDASVVPLQSSLSLNITSRKRYQKKSEKSDKSEEDGPPDAGDDISKTLDESNVSLNTTARKRNRRPEKSDKSEDDGPDGVHSKAMDQSSVSLNTVSRRRTQKKGETWERSEESEDDGPADAAEVSKIMDEPYVFLTTADCKGYEKKGRSDKLGDDGPGDAAEGVNEILDLSTVNLNTTTGRRNRKKSYRSDKADGGTGDASLIMEQADDSLDNRGRRGNRKRSEKSRKSEESPSAPKKARETRRRTILGEVEVVTIEDTTPTPDSDDNEVANVSFQLPLKAAPTNRRFRQLKESTPSDVTPECSPITVTLTPHRTKKTPRKSPVDLGSPKTHDQSPRRLSKTPRKLSVLPASPVPSETSSETPKNAPKKSPKNSAKKSPQKTTKISGKILQTPDDKSPSKIVKDTNKSAGKKLKMDKTSPNISPKNGDPVASPSKNRTIPHSKTPKIVFRKSKSKSKSPVSVRSSKVKRGNKSTSPRKSPKTPRGSKSQNSSMVDGEIGGNMRTPQLILTRISTSLTSPKLAANGDQQRRSESQNESTLKSSPAVQSRLQATLKTELRSSTPRQRGRPTNLSPNSGMSVEKFYGSPRARRSTSRLLEDETLPLDNTFDISGVMPADETEVDKTRSIHKDNTYDLAEPKTPNLKGQGSQESNDTYELDEPKTPGLRSQLGKRSFGSASKRDKSPQDNAKRVCRVRFASPDILPSTKTTPRVAASRSRSATPGERGKQKSTLRRSVSLSNAPKSPAPLSLNRSASTADVSLKWTQKAQNDSINRLSRPRASITGEKRKPAPGSSIKKIPNFAQIHQKKFEKMESVVDAKRRLELRHNALTSHNFNTTKSDEHSKLDKSEKLEVEKLEKLQKFQKLERPENTRKAEKVDKSVGQKPVERLEKVDGSGKKLKIDKEQRSESFERIGRKIEKEKVGRDVTKVEDKIQINGTDKGDKVDKINGIDGIDGEEAKSAKEAKPAIMTEPKTGFNRFGFKLKEQKLLASGSQKSGYNRFGFKLKKDEATKLVVGPTSAKIEERKEVKRMALKGVRTNKRFELLMKSRNIK